MYEKVDANYYKKLYGYSKEFLDDTKALWEPDLGRCLSYQEAADIADNFVNLEMLLRQPNVE